MGGNAPIGRPVRLPAEWTIFPLHPIVGTERSEKRTGSDGLPKRMCGCGDERCTQAGKHPQVFQWGELESGRQIVAKDPAAGLGMATGARSGVLVLDLDYKGPNTKKPVNGIETFAALVAGLGVAWPDTLTVRTGGKGAHLYFAWPGVAIKNSVGEIGPGIDVRCDGGYAVIPDTEHDSGDRYEFLNWGTPIAPLPEWLLARMVRAPGADGGQFPIPQLPLPGGVCTTEDGWRLIDRVVKDILLIPLGQRNERLFQKVAKLGDAVYVGFVSLEDAKYSVLRAVAEAGWGDPGKTADTVDRALKGSSKGRVVEVAVNHKPANDRAIELLAFDESVYVIGDTLARDTGVGISAMSRHNLNELLSSSVDWRKKDKEGNLLPVQVPQWASDEVFDRKSWPDLRHIEGFSAVPILRPDLSVAWEKGYDSHTQVLVGETCPEVPMSYEEAVAVLRDIVCDVEFQTDSHLGAWVCSVLTPLAMHAFCGPMPIFMFEASSAGAGKTNLASISSLISTGVMPSSMAYTGNEEETRKQITTHAMNPSPVLMYDNVSGEFGGDSICKLVTEPDRMWRDRILGGNSRTNLKVNSAMYVTANNIRLGADLERRICPIRVTPKAARPEMRTGFKHDPWIRVVRANRATLTWAALKILQGPKKHALTGWGSYTEWRDLIVGSVLAAGFEDPFAAVNDMRNNSSNHDEDIRGFVSAWQKACFALAPGDSRGLSVKEAWAGCYPVSGGFGQAVHGCEDLREWIEGNWKKGEASTKLLGIRMSHMRDKATDSGALVKGPGTNGYPRWIVR